MQITASWGGADVEVEVDEECRSLAALKRALRSALPEEVDLEKVCLEVGGRAMDALTCGTTTQPSGLSLASVSLTHGS